MLHNFALITAVMIVVSGVYVIAKGSWHQLGLKFAGVVLSTTAAGWMLIATMIFGQTSFACQLGMPPEACLAVQLYSVVRNLAFIVFHVAVGRDAIIIKHRDRRGTACQTSFSKPLPH